MGKSGRRLLKNSWSQDAPKMAEHSPWVAQDSPRKAKLVQDGLSLLQQNPQKAKDGSNMYQDGPKTAPTCSKTL